MIKIADKHFSDLVKKGISLDIIFLLLRSEKNKDLSGFEGKIKNIISTMERKNLLKDGIITDEGRSLLDTLRTDNKEVILKKITKKDDEWAEFLKAYPPNNKFTWKGKQFNGDRGIKKNTAGGKELFTKILNEGEYTVEELKNAVIYECLMKFDSSVQEGHNKMTYFINTESYLRQKQYLNWIEEGKTLTEQQIKDYYSAYDRKKVVKKVSSFDI